MTSTLKYFYSFNVKNSWNRGRPTPNLRPFQEFRLSFWIKYLVLVRHTSKSVLPKPHVRMISNYSFKILRRCIILISWTFMLPYAWDYKRNLARKISARHLRISRIWLGLNMAYCGFILCIILWSLFKGNLSGFGNVISWTSAIGLIFFIGIYSGSLVYETECIYFFNSCLEVNWMLGT